MLNETLEEIMNKGSDGALTRWQLSMALGMPDREVRRMIARYNETADVTPIINQGKGYYIATNPEEVLAVARREKAKARKLNKSADRLIELADKMQSLEYAEMRL